MAVPQWFDEAVYLESKWALLPANARAEFPTPQALKVAIETAGYSVYQHFAKYSLQEGTNPNEFFNTNEYLAAKAAQLTAQSGKTWSALDVAVAFLDSGFTNAYDHFTAFGWKENLNPSNSFDVSNYLAAKATQAGITVDALKTALEANGLDPLSHYIMFGQAEGIAVTEVPMNERPNIGSGQLFTLTSALAGGADVMRLTGDQDVRIDFTNPANQVKGLDLNGDGVIANNGVENNITGVAAGFEIVDAYSRNPLNHYDRVNNFLGDIAFDGTGFQGDGVETNGNIFLGGLGADTAFGGIGNDFLAGGGVGDLAGGSRDTLLGGRNADFFFAELSELTPVDGDVLVVDGGRTADDTAAGDEQSSQDADWLLLEASDDDEPVTIVMNEGNELKDALSPNVTTASGRSMTIYDVENINASGYLYGFLDAMNVEIGGRSYDTRDGALTAPVADYFDINYGLGTSAQMDVTGSSAANIIIAGYDNDVIRGMAGNDLLFGGDLRYIKTHNNNPNLANITNDGMDRLFGGAGDDGLVWEVDGGTYDGGEGNDTLFVTDYSIGRTAATEQLTANQQLDATGTGYDSQVLRIDLGYATYRGYRGDTLGEGTDHSDEANQTSTSNHRAGTADQTNYAGGSATVITGVENVIASGMGGIDYSADGTNNSDLAGFVQQQNYRGSALNMELRGTDGTPVTVTESVGGRDGLSSTEIDALYAQYLTNLGVIYEYDDNEPNDKILTKGEFTALLEAGELTAQTPTTTTTVVSYNGGSNVLYAGTGNDIIEGRTGNDFLMGNEGNDDFVFRLNNPNETISEDDHKDKDYNNGDWVGDGVDVIHRQVQTEAGSNLTTGAFGQDFGLDETQAIGASVLRIAIQKAGGNAAGDELSDVVNNVTQIVTGVKVGGTFQAITLNTAEIQAAQTYQALTDAINVALDATDFGADLQATLQADGVTIYITSAAGRELADTVAEVPGAGVSVNQKANTATGNVFEYGEPEIQVSRDRLIYKAYEDRFMNEGVDDDAVLGSTISLGRDAYAEDLVIDFAADGTRIAEQQKYGISFADLKVEDIVRVEINGVAYQLQVGKELDGTLIANESNNAFVTRLAAYINNFMDDDTAVGAVDADDAGNTLSLTQRVYNGEETVFMRTPVVTLTNHSGGQVPVATVTNYSQHEVHLLDFDGRNGNLDRTNVLFVGEEFINRAALQTANNAGETINGYEAMVIDVGADGDNLAGYEVNLATQFNDNFTVHGDDFLIGGNGNDTINGLSGDDRIQGSLGTDTLDGGKNWYAVKILGETEARVVYMNGWEALSPAARVSALSGLTVSSTTLIDQSEDGENLISGYYNDTLLFQQRDFVAGTTDFTIRLNGFNALATTADFRSVEFRNDGAGVVETDVNGDNVIGNNITTFRNFENIRTVSGVSRAVAGDGQGNDTLDISALSTATFGVSYDLTNRDTAGDVRFTTNNETNDVVAANANTALGLRPVEADYTEDVDVYVMKVDGVENVIGGTGDDLVMIDETEAAKNNLFSGGLGTDRIEYLNGYAAGDTPEPTVNIRVLSAGNSQVMMTGGALGLVQATDTLNSVEYIALNGNTAEGMRENDVLDVTAYTSGVVVDYTNGEVRTGLAAGSGVQVVIDGIEEIEYVWADGNDTVIVADADIMNNNARSDELPGNAKPFLDIQLATFLDYDQTNAGGYGGTGNQRVAFANQTTADITDVINQNQFKFDMSRVGTDADVDTIDYSNEGGRIVAVMNFNANDPNKYVLVSGDGDLDFTDAESRVDHLISVERIVAAQGENSTIDVTNSNRDVNILFSYNQPNQKTNFVEGTHKITALDRQINTVRVADADNQAALGNVDLIEYRDLGDSATINQVQATWNTVEGSDFREYIQLTQWEDGINHTFNLRGGQNEVNYNERTNGIHLVINDVNATVNGIANQFAVRVQHLNAVGGLVGSYDDITSFATDNTFNEAAGARLDTLRIEASQGDLDLIDVQNVDAPGIFLVGEVETSGDSVVTATFDGEGTGLIMSGFEYLWDGIKDDVYEIRDLSNFVSKLTLIDFNQEYGPNDVFTGSKDRDTLKLTNGAFESNVTIRPPVSQTISITADLRMGDGSANDLQRIGVNNINDRAALAVAEGAPDAGDTADNSVGFDFQVLDISAVTATATGASLVDQIRATGSALSNDDEIILGGLNLIQTAGTAINDFDIISLSNASLGTTFTVNLDLGEFQDAASAKIFGFDTDLNTLDLSRITGRNMDVTVTDDAAVGFEVIGSAGNDTITGGAGADTIVGGLGADTLDGSFVPAVGEVQRVTFAPGGTLAVDDILNIGIGANVVSVGVSGSTGADVTIASATADEDQVGSAFASLTAAQWATELGLNTGDVVSVTYDSDSNVLEFQFAAQAGDVAALGFAELAGTNAADNNTVVGTPVNDFVAYAPQGNSVDTFVYLTAADSTAASMDTILNFNIDSGAGSIDDIIDLSAIDANATTVGDQAFAGLSLNNTAQANYAAVAALVTAAFATNDIFVGRTATDAYVFVDADQSGDLGANDMVIKLAGVTDVSGITTAENFIL